MSKKSILTCTDLTIGYRNKKSITKEVSKNLNLDLKQGEMVCLIGPNGAGKSTLIRTLTGIQPALHGEVKIYDQKIENLSSNERAKIFSVVLTSPVQAGYLTAFDVVALGRFPYTNWAGELTDQDTSVIVSALTSVGAEDLARRFIHELSDGERQKVMIARALAQDPELMVLDEPTAYLDLPHKIETMRILRNVAQKTQKSILLSTHDLNLAIRCADQLWIIDRHGTMISGIPEDLILSGFFGSAFDMDGVHFDTIRGEFTIPIEKKGTFRLDASESIQRIWTLYALERIGFTPANGVPPDITVCIRNEQNASFWGLNHPDGEARCTSISELIENISSTCN